MHTLQFQLRDEFIELHRLLKLQGICASGGEAKMLVASGVVQVDGAVELRKACKVRAGQRVQTPDTAIEVLAAPRKSV
jgi:ribosome-associated protein